MRWDNWETIGTHDPLHCDKIFYFAQFYAVWLFSVRKVTSDCLPWWRGAGCVIGCVLANAEAEGSSALSRIALPRFCIRLLTNWRVFAKWLQQLKIKPNVKWLLSYVFYSLTQSRDSYQSGNCYCISTQK